MEWNSCIVGPQGGLGKSKATTKVNSNKDVANKWHTLAKLMENGLPQILLAYNKLTKMLLDDRQP